MHKGLLAIAVLFTALPAVAQTQQEIDWCVSDSATADQTIAGCGALIESGRYDPADTAIAYSNRGIAHIANGQFDRALADLDQAIALDPNNFGAYYPRADIHIRNGASDAALADLNEYFARGGRLPGAYKSRGDLYYADGLHDRALADYNAYLAGGPGDIETYYKRGNIHYDAGRYDQALADYSRYIAADPGADMVLAYRGDTHWKLGRNAEAIADYRASLALFPDNQVALDGLERLGAAASVDPTVAVPPISAPLGGPQSAGPAPLAAAGGQCVTMQRIPGSPIGQWRVTNLCGYTLSGTYCFQNGTQWRCSDAAPGRFGPVVDGGTLDVSGPGEQTSGLPGEIVYRLSYCPHEELAQGMCTLPTL